MRYIIFCIFFLSLWNFWSESFALDEETLSGKVTECIEARRSGKEASITEYVCPSGDFSRDSSQSSSREVLCGNIYIQLSFQEIDIGVEKYMKELQDTRNPDMTSWNENIHLQRALWEEKYTGVCDLGKGFVKYCAKTSDFFPESSCRDRAIAKTQAWTNMAYILAGQGIAKSYQNDKDTYMEKMKKKYANILDKWTRYKGIFTNAVEKMDAYIRKAVK